MQQERRKEQRWPAYLGGRIVIQPQLTTADCLVRSTSASGARLAVHQSGLLPDEFLLQIPKRETQMRVRARWRSLREIGVEIVPDDTVVSIDPEVAHRMRELDRKNAALKRRLAQLAAASD